MAGNTKIFVQQKLKKSERLVTRTVDAINSFINPFNMPDKRKLHVYCLSAGAAASAEIQRDVM